MRESGFLSIGSRCELEMSGYATAGLRVLSLHYLVVERKNLPSHRVALALRDLRKPSQGNTELTEKTEEDIGRRVALVLTRQLSTVNCQLPTANCQLPTANCQLPTANCQLPTDN